MQRESILQELRADSPKLQKEFGVKSIGLFGSYARKDEPEESDLDFLVEITPPLVKNYFGLLSFLEEKFITKVDLVTKGEYLSERFLKHVESEIGYV